MTIRADYCPIGGEPCQSMCATPCARRKPLTDEQIEKMVQQGETLRYHFALNGGAGPVSEKGKKIIRAVMAGGVAT